MRSIVIGLGTFGTTVVRTVLRQAADLGRLERLVATTSFLVTGHEALGVVSRVEQEAERSIRRCTRFSGTKSDGSSVLSSELFWLLSAKRDADAYGLFVFIVVDPDTHQIAGEEIDGVLFSLNQSLERLRLDIDRTMSVLVLCQGIVEESPRLAKVLKTAQGWSEGRDDKGVRVTRVLVSGQGYDGSYFEEQARLQQFAVLLELSLIEGVVSSLDVRETLLRRSRGDDSLLGGFFIAVLEHRHRSIQHACCAVLGERVVDEILRGVSKNRPPAVGRFRRKTAIAVDRLKEREQGGHFEAMTAIYNLRRSVSTGIQELLERLFPEPSVVENIKFASRDTVWKTISEEILNQLDLQEGYRIYIARQELARRIAKGSAEVGRELEDAVFEDLASTEDPASLQEIELCLDSIPRAGGTERVEERGLEREKSAEPYRAVDLLKSARILALRAKLVDLAASTFSVQAQARLAWILTSFFVLGVHSWATSVFATLTGSSVLGLLFAVLKHPFGCFVFLSLLCSFVTMFALRNRQRRAVREANWMLNPHQGRIRAALEATVIWGEDALLRPSETRIEAAGQAWAILSARLLRDRAAQVRERVKRMRDEALWLQRALEDLAATFLRRRPEASTGYMSKPDPSTIGAFPPIREYRESREEVERQLGLVEHHNPRVILRRLLEEKSWIPYQMNRESEEASARFLDVLKFIDKIRQLAFGQTGLEHTVTWGERPEGFLKRVRSRKAGPDGTVDEDGKAFLIHPERFVPDFRSEPELRALSQTGDRIYFLRLKTGLDELVVPESRRSDVHDPLVNF